jgi:hypothetical protein
MGVHLVVWHLEKVNNSVVQLLKHRYVGIYSVLNAILGDLVPILFISCLRLLPKPNHAETRITAPVFRSMNPLVSF